MTPEKYEEEKAYIIEHCFDPEQRRVELDKLDAERRKSAVAVPGDFDSDGGDLYCFEEG